MSLFGADQVYTCLEKVYMVYTGLPPDVQRPSAYLRGEMPSVCAHEWLGAIAGYIPKALSELLITEFRPVASICSKFMIFLKIIYVWLDHLTEDYGLINDAQDGFYKGRSTKR